MYLTLKISAKTFEAVRAAMADSRTGDYYNTPAGASSKLPPRAGHGFVGKDFTV